MRSELLNLLFTGVTRVRGVGGGTAQALSRLLPAATSISGAGVPIIRDLLFHLPSSVVDRRFSCPLVSAPDGVVATFIVSVVSHQPPPVAGRKFGKKPYKIICSNETGDIALVFFNAREDYLKQILPVGGQRVISGRTEKFDYRLQMTHPDIITTIDKIDEVKRVEAVYPLTIGLTSRRLAKIVADALEKMPELPEWILPETLAAHSWQSWRQTILAAHNPATPEDILPTAAPRLRLAYDEMLAGQLHLARLRQNRQKQAANIITGTGEFSEQLIHALPYTLTAGQREVLAEIAADMASGSRMGRLLQGDVGSGKTIVALLAMLKAVEQGFQCALMVPTELIAQQHFEVISGLLSALLPPPLRGRGGVGGMPSHRNYPVYIKEFARALRKNPTEAEQKFWSILRNNSTGFKFRRQFAIDGKYIADFVCLEKRLIIEIDGGQHNENEVDAQRTLYLEEQNFRVIRFWNNEILQNLDGCYQILIDELHKEFTPLPNPPPQGGRELLVALLTGSIKGAARKQVMADIASGAAQIVVGTHALFQEQVEFKNLAMIVIDEQHRFGVNQRMALSAKGNAPHILHMTATPIPRSLTMTIYGDMDCSLLREKPAQRQPITTRIIPLSRYDEIIYRLQAALDRGEKAYWICPLVEGGADGGDELADDDVAAATTRHTEFQARFGEIVGMVHGRMKADARDAAMHDFAHGKTRLLVATTVVEVGVDVRDATIIVIEKAERFGLAQLHQLRGRVGRGDKASACVLLYSDNISENGKSRLSILRETEDGFRIAEADLAIRGGGELLGTRQSGLPRFIFTDLAEHQELLEAARADATAFLSDETSQKSDRAAALEILLQLFGYSGIYQ